MYIAPFSSVSSEVRQGSNHWILGSMVIFPTFFQFKNASISPFLGTISVLSQTCCSMPSRPPRCSVGILGERSPCPWDVEVMAQYRIHRMGAGCFCSYRGRKIVQPPVLGQTSNLPHNEIIDEKSENDIIQTLEIRTVARASHSLQWLQKEHIRLTPAYLVYMQLWLFVCVPQVWICCDSFCSPFMLCNHIIQPSFYSLPSDVTGVTGYHFGSCMCL